MNNVNNIINNSNIIRSTNRNHNNNVYLTFLPWRLVSTFTLKTAISADFCSGRSNKYNITNVNKNNYLTLPQWRPARCSER